jgi:hypothetical protein
MSTQKRTGQGCDDSRSDTSKLCAYRPFAFKFSSGLRRPRGINTERNASAFPQHLSSSPHPLSCAHRSPSMQFKLFAAASLLAFVQTALAFPRVTPEEFKRVVRDAASRPEIRDGQVGRVVRFDPPPSFTGTKKIPDAAHPFRAPGKNDLRGPCRKLFSFG